MDVLMRWIVRGVGGVLMIMVVAMGVMNEHQVSLHIPIRGTYEIPLYHLLFVVMAGGVMLGAVSTWCYERCRYRALKKRHKQQEAKMQFMEQEVQALRAEAQAVQNARLYAQETKPHDVSVS
jgi:uncharacterized integral membrane protein